MRFNLLPSKALTVIFLLSSASIPSFAQPGEDYVPWALREHYVFAGQQATFKFDVKSAEWMVDVKDSGVLIRDVQCEIEFADGEVLRLSDLEAISDEREKLTGPLGEGKYFNSTFRTSNGLKITYSLVRFEEHPFFLLFVSLENKGRTPIEIAAVRPAVFDQGAIATLEEGSSVARMRTTRRGFFPVVNDTDNASLIRFSLPQNRVSIGIGVVQTGLLNSYIDVSPGNRSWSGSVQCEYEPSLHIKPGMKVGSDPVWLSFSIRDPLQVRAQHAKAEAAGAPQLNLDAIPRAWISVKEGRPAKALYKAAEAWRATAVTHALVPSTWPARPGALRGDGKAYPKGMDKVARQIEALGFVPGITINPLAVDGGSNDWSVLAQDGTRWLDITHRDALDHGVLQTRRIVDWGFKFLVVQPPTIPEDVLRKFNVTRAQADSFALEIAARAGSGLPVFPSADVALEADFRQWRQAVIATSLYPANGLIAAPVRFVVGNVNDLSPPLADALRGFGGPVELIGVPGPGVRGEIADIRILDPNPGASYSQTPDGR